MTDRPHSTEKPPHDPVRRSTCAIVSFWLGCLSFLFFVFTGLPALVLGVIGFFEVVLSRGKVRGKFLSLAGVALSIGSTWFGFYGLVHARDGSRIIASMQALRITGSTIQLFESARGRFPSAVETKTSDRPHSWRVSCEFVLGENEIRGRYRFDEPWNSPNNQRLLAEVPFCYRSCGDDDIAPGATSVVAITGDETMWPSQQTLTSRDVKDSPAETLLLIEIANSQIPWTEPRDMTIEDFAKGIDQPGGPQSIYPQGLLGLFADGKVRIIPRDASPAQLRALATRNGGENITIAFVPD